VHPLLRNYFKLIKRFIPSTPESPSVGLDIGASECKLVELIKSEDSFELLSWAIEPVKNDDVSATVQRILEPLEIPCKSPYTAVSGKGTLIRYIDMPRMTIEDLRNSFSIEADKYFPFAQDQIYTDCYILDPQGKEKRMSVMAAAAKREMIDQRIKLLTEAGLHADFIGINPIALANVLNVLGLEEEKDEDAVMAVLDMGESVSNLTIIIDKLPWFTRDIFVGGRDLTKSISNALGISFEDAEKLKSQPGKRLAEVIAACESAVMNMVQELRLSFDYFTTERSKEITKLLLTGGGSMLEGISEAFEKNLEVKVNKWDPLESLQVSSEISKEDLDKKSLKLGVALGLALYQYD